jgi:nitroreductase
MNKLDILKAAKWRSAIKQFDPDKKISDENFEFLLEMARFSPSSFGLEQWNLIVVQSKSPPLYDQLKLAVEWGAELQFDTASHFVIFTSRNVEPESDYFAHMKRDIQKLSEEDLRISIGYLEEFQNDLLDLTDTRKRHDWAGKQAYIAMANMMLAAAEIGIDSCPIEGFDMADVEKILNENNIIDLNVDRVAAMCAFGYRAGRPPHAKTRRPMDEIVRWV